jgi:hypothetical protein
MKNKVVRVVCLLSFLAAASSAFAAECRPLKDPPELAADNRLCMGPWQVIPPRPAFKAEDRFDPNSVCTSEKGATDIVTVRHEQNTLPRRCRTVTQYSPIHEKRECRKAIAHFQRKCETKCTFLFIGCKTTCTDSIRDEELENSCGHKMAIAQDELNAHIQNSDPNRRATGSVRLNDRRPTFTFWADENYGDDRHYSWFVELNVENVAKWEEVESAGLCGTYQVDAADRPVRACRHPAFGMETPTNSFSKVMLTRNDLRVAFPDQDVSKAICTTLDDRSEANASEVGDKYVALMRAKNSVPGAGIHFGLPSEHARTTLIGALKRLYEGSWVHLSPDARNVISNFYDERPEYAHPGEPPHTFGVGYTCFNDAPSTWAPPAEVPAACKDKLEPIFTTVARCRRVAQVGADKQLAKTSLNTCVIELAADVSNLVPECSQAIGNLVGELNSITNALQER